MALQGTLNDLRKPILELKAGVTSSLAELKKATKAASAPPKAAGSKKTKGSATTKPTQVTPATSLFEVAADIFHNMGSLSLPLGEDFDVSKPCIIKPSPEDCAKLKSDAVKAGLEDFKKAFAKCTQREKEGRAVQKLVEGTTAYETVKTAFGKTFPEKLHVDLSTLNEHLKLKDHLAWMNFGIAESKVDTSCERDLVATIKYTYVGTRVVIIVPFPAIIDHMKEKGCEGPFSSKRAASFFKNLPAESARLMAPKYTVYHGTVGPNDMLYCPAGSCVHERVQPSQDVIGLKVGCFLKDARNSKSLAAMKTEEEIAGVIAQIVGVTE